uniref:Inositol-1-monophosphatase n=1 Tax=Amphora coffeiformis TaxID=265554 RepID=A0A7S3P9K1_9STRA|mmetsp:Transcript_3415/g.6542  ORF Transcript_3415/g.6542 Transcript_3415/m.6542 type:complete len:338 (+) Transcript_3415:105-1118(+)|eukprot:scaffold4910_cov169-Amphora_coffeaeformis.AAC.9
MASSSRDPNNFLMVVGSMATGAGLMWWWQQQRSRRSGANNSKYMLPSALSSSPYRQQVQLALQLALQAGRNMYPYCDETGTAKQQRHDLGISTKSKPEDFFTHIDVENETLVMQGIQAAFPHDAIIGEESVGTGGIPPLKADTPTWIIDPIDGTTNFASGLPLTCVSIGYCVGGVPVMGVVYAPMTDEVFMAVKGHGCFRNGVRIQLLKNKKQKQLAEAMICFEFGYSRQPAQVARMVGAVQRILNHGCRATRHLGSGVLDLCYVATGRLDAVYAGVAGEGWKPWDFCAGLVISEEAGCVIEAIDQKQRGPFDIYSSSHICASSQELLEEVRKLVEN